MFNMINYDHFNSENINKGQQYQSLIILESPFKIILFCNFIDQAVFLILKTILVYFYKKNPKCVSDTNIINKKNIIRRKFFTESDLFVKFFKKD